MFFQFITYPAHNIILAMIDYELLHKIFLEQTNRFDYGLKVNINDKNPNIAFIDYYKDSLVIATDEEDETIPENITIEFHIDLIWKIEEFNGIKNERSDEITQIYEVWEFDTKKRIFVLKESNFTSDVRKDVLNIHLKMPDEEKPALVDKDFIDGSEIIDVEFNEVNNKQLTMNDGG